MQLYVLFKFIYIQQQIDFVYRTFIILIYLVYFGVLGFPVSETVLELTQFGRTDL